ncbi:PD40 domain-containing protein [Candidatus Poribacteria bacterium]|nr:PD40 domain-containing protein [Candidatus Poribacteria bacterium]
MKFTAMGVLFSLTLVCSSICRIWAQAPETPKIAFTSSRDGNRDIYLMNPDGTQQVKITNHRARDGMSAWSPTGEQILFSSDRNKQELHWDIYLMDADGSNVQAVFAKSADRSQPAWSPDGKQIAYTRREPSGNFIYISTIDGKQEEKVAIGGCPTWSPDGTEIAFVSGAPERSHISILNLGTRKQKVIFPPKAPPSWISGRVVWSPKGDKLAFSWLHRVPLRDFADTQTIYTVNRDGTGLVQLVGEAGPDASDPVWSPQGDALLYIHEDRQIFKIGVDEKQVEQLTHIGVNYLGDWFDPAYALPVSPQPQLLTTTWGKLKRE